VQFVSQNLPELVGARYVGQFFKTSDRDAVEAMAPFMKQAFRARIQQARWLDQTTRTRALAKLDKMGLRLGYPDDLRDYSEVEISPTDPIGNLHRLKAAQVDPDVQLLQWLEREFTLYAMKATKGNQVRAAKLLGITRATLRKRIERFGITRELTIS
jgi:endothelin-converting enzyme/putative endopeptidase